MKKRVAYYDGMKAGGAPIMWERVLGDALGEMKHYIPAGSRILEVGYGDGLLTCYLCSELGWNITGFDIDPNAYAVALKNALRFCLRSQIQFCCCLPDETRKHNGQYDAVFIKTVLYNSATIDEYKEWLDWILSVLKPGGILVNFETGRANALTQYYRKIRKRSYTSLCLYTSEIEALYDERFEIITRRYYGGLSQFFAPLPPLYFLVSRLEEAIQKRHADNCFIVSVIARRPLKK